MKSTIDTRQTTEATSSLFPGHSRKLQAVWRGDTERLHQLAMELASQPDAVMQERLHGLEQWERLQVLDEIRHRLAG